MTTAANHYDAIARHTILLVLLQLAAVGPFRPCGAALGGGSAAVRPETAATAPAVWSKFGLVVQRQDAGGESPHTTETSGIIIKAPDPKTTRKSPPPPPPSTAIAPTALGKSWTQISVTQPPPRTSQLTVASTPVKFAGVTTTRPPAAAALAIPANTQDIRRDIPSRYQALISTSKPIITITFPPPHRHPTSRPAVSAEEVTSKRVRQYEDDDDDDDDDVDDDDDDDDVYDVEDDDEDSNVHQDKGEQDEEIEEIIEVQHIDSDSYADEKPAIVKKKKRRRKKKGKKHKPFKVKDFKKLKKFMLPLLLAYKLKFFTLVPLMLGGLVLIVATTGFAGFFFALFAVGLGLKGHH